MSSGLRSKGPVIDSATTRPTYQVHSEIKVCLHSLLSVCNDSHYTQPKCKPAFVMEGDLSNLRDENSCINIGFDRVSYNCSLVIAHVCYQMANGALCDAIHRIHHRALFLKYRAISRCPHKSSFTFTTKVWRSLLRFSRISLMQNLHISCTEFNSNRTINPDIRSSTI